MGNRTPFVFVKVSRKDTDGVSKRKHRETKGNEPLQAKERHHRRAKAARHQEENEDNTFMDPSEKQPSAKNAVELSHSTSSGHVNYPSFTDGSSGVERSDTPVEQLKLVLKKLDGSESSFRALGDKLDETDQKIDIKLGSFGVRLDKLGESLKDVKDSHKDFEKKLSDVDLHLGKLDDSHNAVEKKLEEFQDHLSKHDSKHDNVEDKIKSIKTRLDQVESKPDIENNENFVWTPLDLEWTPFPT
ncbi:hypothetical protein B0T21DRAFT_359471 [Apiosordaria backusii]|uniref:Uncharacterized protein n=1 Tax=Apiosordaria backusii TaxID=314023 RepID=A0AA40ETP2_9PEZI|nr:hypothetical protein B0T21DRAFT_359471 [Apiosordaria backusii]